MGMIGLGFSLIVEERLKMFDAYYATIMPITITLPYTLSPCLRFVHPPHYIYIWFKLPKEQNIILILNNVVITTAITFFQMAAYSSLRVN